MRCHFKLNAKSLCMLSAISLTTFAMGLLIQGCAVAPDDVPRFTGSWHTTATVNGQPTEFLAENNGSAFKNYVITPQGPQLTQEGTLSASGGKWFKMTATGQAIYGSYVFLNNDSVQVWGPAGTSVWTRVAPATPPTPAAPPPAN